MSGRPDGEPNRTVDVGTALSRTLDARGLRRSDAAVRAGLSRPRLSAVLSQDDAMASTLVRVADAAGYELRLVPAELSLRPGEIRVSDSAPDGAETRSGDPNDGE